MCGRFTLYQPEAELRERFHAVVADAPVEPRYNIAPTQPIAVVRETQERQLEAMRWGLVPAWAKDDRKPLINIRANTLAEKPYFRTALTRRRCLIPASGFYEWREADNPSEGGKTPIYFRPTGEDILGLAGIWEERAASDGSSLITCAIITTEPNALTGMVHDRMPVIVPRDQEDRWLSLSEQSASELLLMLAPYPTELLEAYPVGRGVNSPAHDDSQNIVPQGASLQVAL